MATLIKARRISADNWRLFNPGPGGALSEAPAAGDVIVPLAFWQAGRDTLLARPGRFGVWLDSNQGPEAVAGDLEHFALIAVSFPTLADGRGYSTARLLRERYRFAGELRAIGEVHRDQLLFLEQCGFDAFALSDGEDAEDALRAFGEISQAYQVSVTQPVPLFRRRSATGAPS